MLSLTVFTRPGSLPPLWVAPPQVLSRPLFAAISPSTSPPFFLFRIPCSPPLLASLSDPVSRTCCIAYHHPATSSPPSAPISWTRCLGFSSPNKEFFLCLVVFCRPVTSPGRPLDLTELFSARRLLFCFQGGGVAPQIFSRL